MPTFNQNITSTTREMFVRSVAETVFPAHPVFMKLKNRVNTQVAGPNISRPVQINTMTALMQRYAIGDPLRAGSVTLMTKASFYWKRWTIPVMYNDDDRIAHAGGSETNLVDFAKFLVETAHNSAIDGMVRDFWGMSTDPSSVTCPSVETDDNGKAFQSVRQALSHTATYGTLTRAVGTATTLPWMGASIAEAFYAASKYADQATAYPCTVANLQRAATACMKYNPRGKKSKLLTLLGPKNYQDLRNEIGAGRIDTSNSELAKFGFDAFMVHGIGEVCEDPYLSETFTTGASKWMAMIYPDDWELRFDPTRYMKMTPFVELSAQVNGSDAYLARIKSLGNLVCWFPRHSLYLSNFGTGETSG